MTAPEQPGNGSLPPHPYGPGPQQVPAPAFDPTVPPTVPPAPYGPNGPQQVPTTPPPPPPYGPAGPQQVPPPGFDPTVNPTVPPSPYGPAGPQQVPSGGQYGAPYGAAPQYGAPQYGAPQFGTPYPGQPYGPGATPPPPPGSYYGAAVQFFAPGGQPLAGIGTRFAARLIDGAIVVVGLLLLVLLLGVSTGGAGFMAAGVLVGFLSGVVAAAYELTMVATRGQTLGKMALGIKVVGADGGVPGWKTAAIRWVVPFALGLVPLIDWLLILACYLTAIPDPQNRGWHDKAAKTWVVVAGPQQIQY